MTALDTTVTIQTPEFAAYEMRLAGPAARSQAFLIDLLLRILVFVVIAIFTDHQGVMLLSWFVLSWLYGFILEWRWNGQTIGKKALGIQAVGQEGSPITAGQAAIRNLLRGIDALPFGNLVGVVVMTGNDRFQRLGDLAAGTVVTYTGDASLSVGGFQSENKKKQGPELDLPALPQGMILTLPSTVLKAVMAYTDVRDRFSQARRQEMALHLAPALEAQLGLRGHDPDQLLIHVHRSAVTSDTTGGDARHRLLKALPSLEKLSKQLDKNNPFEGSTPSHISGLYRQMCAARSLGQAWLLPANTLGMVDDLVGRMSRFFHRDSSGGPSRFAKLILLEAPALMLREGALWIAIGLFFGSFGLAVIAVHWDPGLPASILGQETIEKFRSMYATAPDSRNMNDAATMGGYYVLNNVSIALNSFAFGLAFGIGSAIVLLFNGVVIGLIFGALLTAPAPVPAHFTEFVRAHGPFELMGIVFCGAAGMRMGWSMVAHNNCTMIQGLRKGARRALPMLVAGALFVALAAPIEGLISPSSAGLSFKTAVMWTTAALILVWLIGFGSMGLRRGFGRIP